ncbi:MAG: hypothetical protein M1840_006958 [Geoglossum simile]|nr:MAG: hypothetical protein M1840_006958 [Geoglossum simile]
MGKFLLAAAAVLTAMLHIAAAAFCDTSQPRLDGDPSGDKIAEILANSYTRENACSPPSHNRDSVITRKHFGMLYNATRIIIDKPLPNCTEAFTDIVAQCITGGNYWGGIWASTEATYTISNTMYPASAFPPDIARRAEIADPPIVFAIVDPAPANWDVVIGPVPLPTGPLPDGGDF